MRSKASQTLKYKKFGIREQFPKVIEDKRKSLYPEAKKARENEQNKVRLVRDRLFVNNKEVIVEHGEGMGTSHSKRPDSYWREYQWSNGTTGGYRGSRVFYRGGKKHKGSMPRRHEKTPGVIDFTHPNMFGPLAETPSHGQNKNAGSKKHRASLPLEEQALKKQRDGSDSESVSSHMNIDSTQMNVDPSNIIIQPHIDSSSNPTASNGENLDTATLINDKSVPNKPNSVTSTLMVHITSPGTAPLKDSGNQESDVETCDEA